jgi:hypothetical protein
VSAEAGEQQLPDDGQRNRALASGAPQMKPRSAALSVSVGTLATLAIAFTSIGSSDPVRAASESEKRVYEGWLGPRRDSDRVRMSVRLEDGRPVSGRFRASKVFFSCDEGERRVSFDPIRVRFHGRFFEAERYRAGGSDGLERYLRLEGGLVEQRTRASGFFFAFTDPADDDPHRACGTHFLVSWKALLRS